MGMPGNSRHHRTRRCTEWRPRGVSRRFGTHGGAAIGELSRSLSYCMKLSFKIRLVQWLACALCLIVLLLVAVVLWPQPQVSGLAITFAGFTNALGEPRSALFGVTNSSRRSISFVILDPQIRTDGRWSEVAAVVRRMTLTLAGGQGTNVTMAVASRGEAWRMPVLWVYEPNSAEFY